MQWRVWAKMKVMKWPGQGGQFLHQIGLLVVFTRGLDPLAVQWSSRTMTGKRWKIKLLASESVQALNAQSYWTDSTNLNPIASASKWIPDYFNDSFWSRNYPQDTKRSPSWNIQSQAFKSWKLITTKHLCWSGKAMSPYFWPKIQGQGVDSKREKLVMTIIVPLLRPQNHIKDTKRCCSYWCYTYASANAKYQSW